MTTTDLADQIHDRLLQEGHLEFLQGGGDGRDIMRIIRRSIQAGMLEALAMDSPWPVPEMLARLTAAAEHLLRDHDCDTHGYEGIGVAAQAARQWLILVYQQELQHGEALIREP